jgi:Fe-S-cluster containining protein
MRHPGGLLIAGRKSWFKIIENLYARTRQAVLPCHRTCPDLLCETTDSEQALFLPYELEYIQNQLHLTSNPFETILLGNQTYGYMSGKRDCPYFKPPDCQIHDLRPFDCRSFPILPRFDPKGSVHFFLSPYCPLSDKTGTQFLRLIMSSWQGLASDLPGAWKDHYNRLYLAINLIPVSP